MNARSPALAIEIDRLKPLPIYLQICERFRTAIAAGHLRPGERVPALRNLSTQLSTARGTVELAYSILVDEGYLQMRGAAGTFVSPSLPASVVHGAVENKAGSAKTRAAQRSQPTRSEGTVTVAMSGEPRPLQPGLPALDAFPRKIWSRLVSRRVRSGDRAMLGYPDPMGYRPLRERIATYLGLSRGVTCLPGAGVHYRRISRDARTRAAQSRAIERSHVVRGSRLSARA